MINATWYYLAGDKVATAKIIGETPRKWILREDSATAFDWGKTALPGELSYDWTIPKIGDIQREGRGFRGQTRKFFRAVEIAQSEIVKQRAEHWRYQHIWKIAKQVEQIRDPDLLKKVAELIGYKEDSDP